MSMVYRQPISADMDMDIVPMSVTVCHNNGAFYDVTTAEPCTDSNVYTSLKDPTACGKGKADENVYDLPDMDDCHVKEMPSDMDEHCDSVYLHTNEPPPNTDDQDDSVYLHTNEPPISSMVQPVQHIEDTGVETFV